MKFDVYEEKFRKQAREQDKDEQFVLKCLEYAKNLHSKNIPIIYDIDHFSMLVGVKVSVLLAMSNSPRCFYRTFSIPKHNGKLRKIDEPLPLLKEIQIFILENILQKVSCSIYSKAYRKGLSIRDNARFHRNQPVLIKLDIKDYFPSLSYVKVYEFFYEVLGYSKNISVLLARLCTLDGGLPQGAPSSPYLSNLLTKQLDDEIQKFCTDVGKLRYTRYADDIFVSGDIENAKYIVQSISNIVYANGLHINREKIAVIGRSSQQVVTGVVVNKKLQASKTYRKGIRQEVYYCKKYGLENHFNSLNNQYPEFNQLTYVQHLLGKINFCLQINKNDMEMQEYKSYLIEKIKEIL